MDSTLKRKHKQKPFKAWMLCDMEGTYEPTLHWRRATAESERREFAYLLDARWRIVRVKVTPVLAARR